MGPIWVLPELACGALPTPLQSGSSLPVGLEGAWVMAFENIQVLGARGLNSTGVVLSADFECSSLGEEWTAVLNCVRPLGFWLQDHC